MTESNEKGHSAKIEEIIKQIKITKPTETLIKTLKLEQIYKETKPNKEEKIEETKHKQNKININTERERIRKEQKQKIKIGSWNIQTINGKEQEITEEINERGIQILGASETKKKGTGSIALNNKYTLRYSGVDKTERATEGVALITNEEIDKKIVDWKAINSRIIYMDVNLETNITIIQIYAPREGTEIQKIEEFYETLQEQLEEARERDREVLIIGDWNGRIGKDTNKAIGCMGRYGTEETLNQNGKRILDFCITNDMQIGNTFFNHGKEPQYTYESQDGKHKSILDYITYTKTFEEKVKDVWVEKQAELGTDHKLILMEIEEVITRKEEAKQFIKIQTEKLRDMEIRQRYHEEVEKRLGGKLEGVKEQDLEEIWKSFKEITITTAKDICGTKKINGNRKSSRWWNNEVKAKIKEKKKAWKKYIITGKIEDKVKYIQKRDEAKQEVKKAKTKTWEEFGKEVEREYGTNKSKFWRTIRALKSKKHEQIWNIEDHKAELKTETEEILEVWSRFYEEKFQEVKNQYEKETTEENTHTEQPENEISQEEITQTLKTLKTGKAAGRDEITPELIKWGGKEMIKWITLIFRKAWTNNKIPKDWEKNIIIPLYKKGKKCKCENYRAICITSTLFKMYTKIIENKLRNEVATKLEEEQAAYMKGKQTQDHISIVRKVIESATEQGKELYLVFVDLKAAFDTVPRGKLWQCLEEMEVTGKLRQVIKSIYKTVRGEVRIKGKYSREFEMQKGVKQGDSLSPLLFNIYMDKILKMCKENTPKITVGYRELHPVQLQSLLYADDIIIMGNNRTNIQKILNQWDKTITQMGMEINTGKTKVMIINGKQDQQNFKCGKDELEQVSTIDYLGTKISDNGKMNTEILSRTRKATQVFYQLNKTILGKREINTKTKTTIYNAVAVPIMTYGSETWPISTKHESKLTASEMKFLRKITGKTKRDRCRNEDIRKSVQQKPITQIIEEKQLKWFGHVQRMQKDVLTRKVAESKRQGKRRVGRPSKNMEQRLEELAKKRGKTVNQLRQMTEDRKKWRTWVDTPT